MLCNSWTKNSGVHRKFVNDKRLWRVWLWKAELEFKQILRKWRLHQKKKNQPRSVFREMQRNNLKRTNKMHKERIKDIFGRNISERWDIVSKKDNLYNTSIHSSDLSVKYITVFFYHMLKWSPDFLLRHQHKMNSTHQYLKKKTRCR